MGKDGIEKNIFLWTYFLDSFQKVNEQISKEF